MKIIAVNRPIEQATIDTFPIVDIIPDSAIIKEGKPFFIPDFSSEWKYQATIAFRITRLGKNIVSKFAPRYYDAIAIAVRTIPCDIASSPSAIAKAFDGSFIIGEWLPIEDIDTSKPMVISIGDKSVTINPSELMINDTIAILSKFLTLKIGDIIAPATIPLTESITINTIVTGKIENINDDCLKLKFK